MKSIRRKISLVILLCVLCSTWLVGFITIFTFKNSRNKDSVKILNLLCSENAGKINELLSRIEKSVEILADYSVHSIDNISKLKTNEAYREKYIKDVDSLGLSIAKRTESAVAVYVRFSPEVTTSKSGFFRVKNAERNEFVSQILTDLALYSKDNIGRVGWYYIPKKEGKPIWLKPYYNFNINVNMISYVIPIYKDSMFLGVVGMDIDFDYLVKEVDKILVYDTGHALLTDKNLNVVHSLHYPKGPLIDNFYKANTNLNIESLFSEKELFEYEFEGKKRKIALHPLLNNMCLAVTVLDSEINEKINFLISMVALFTILIPIVIVVISIFFARGITKPLADLTNVAKEISDGNLDVPIECNSDDEVGILANGMRETVEKLRIRMEKMNILAYTDKLTGVNNNTAYVHDINKLVEQKKSFGIFLIDINGLKIINDTLGHDKGNELIISVSKCIVKVFGVDFVYRIGGDEFVGIKLNASIKDCKNLHKKLNQKFEEYKNIIKYSAAIGYSLCDADCPFEDAFKKADAQMYENKKNMKM